MTNLNLKRVLLWWPYSFLNGDLLWALATFVGGLAAGFLFTAYEHTQLPQYYIRIAAILYAVGGLLFIPVDQAIWTNKNLSKKWQTREWALRLAYVLNVLAGAILALVISAGASLIGSWGK